MLRVMAKNGGPLGYIDNPYPCGVFPQKGIGELCFRPVTILYGGNGSGKSTLLNLIARRLGLSRIAPHNSGETFDLYAERCVPETGFDDEGERWEIPAGSRMITSDDVFDYMLTMRSRNDEITQAKEQAKQDYAALKFGENIRFKGMENYEDFRLQVMARKKSLSRRKFIRRFVGSEMELASNGETALQYFQSQLANDTLYCLDEPENSMSPAMQLKLVELLHDMSRYCGCQLIIATHSPFLLAMEGARIYDLDSRPV